jgi:Uma2 family endonuclease
MEISMPVTLRMGDLMSDDEFFQFCQINDTLEFERDSQGNVIVMSRTGSLSGLVNTHFTGHLFSWNERLGLGVMFSSSTGFTLPNGAVRSPDASWIKTERWDRLSDDEKEKFVPICPDFVVEVRSKSDEPKYMSDKMKEYISNGAQLGWLIDRFEKKAYIFRQDGSVETAEINAVLSGEEVLPGFTLDLGELIK